MPSQRQIRVSAQKSLRLVTEMPGDKSISHRSLIFGALASGTSRIKNLLEADDCVSTLKIFRAMGVLISRKKNGITVIRSRGALAFRKPKHALNCGNSGTTMRLMTGILSAQPFNAVLTGDPTLLKRPMDRVAIPLTRMGAAIRGRGSRCTAPLRIRGTAHLKAIRYALPVASAQVKSAILLAGLYAKGVTQVTEPVLSRDHTERFLRLTGVRFYRRGKILFLKGGQQPRPFQVEVPGDISSAAFLMAVGLLVPRSRIRLRKLLWNATRTGVVTVLKRMGARPRVTRMGRYGPESVADIEVRPMALRATRIHPREIPSLIDELPILMVIATQARGRTWIRGAGELRVKETDRIEAMVSQLKKMGARIESRGPDVVVTGPTPLVGTEVDSFHDHRTAMSLIIAGMIASGTTRVKRIENIATSFPNFLSLLRKSGVRFK